MPQGVNWAACWPGEAWLGRAWRGERLGKLPTVPEGAWARGLLDDASACCRMVRWRAATRRPVDSLPHWRELVVARR